MKKSFLEKILSYNENYNMEVVGKAYDVAYELHSGQMRKSGEPYIIHPIAVTTILAQLGMDEETLVAGLLHDVVEDTDYTRTELIDDFGEDVALLVDGVTKLGNIKFDSQEEAQAENLRKMFLAMAKDIRVLIIKLADRLHNMRTAEYWSPSKQLEKAHETLDIYAPLASRLGIYTIKFELEDISLKYLHPMEYETLQKEVENKRGQREKLINDAMLRISGALEKMGVKHDISGRSKHLYSVYKKMTIKNKQLDEIFDLTAIRLIVETVHDCYFALGQVHTMWKPIPGRFKDYIAMPKSNMYQSLHTTVIGDRGEPFEIQIRTYEMHRVAEYGIAAHWKYKEGISDSNKSSDELKLAWVRQTLEWQQEMKDPREFMETLKMDLFSSQVFVFTPKGEVIDLPAGSTPLDFAFKIHTDIGKKCVGAKVDGKMVTIDYPLKNGNIVEIITSANSAGPSVHWLKIVKSSSAKIKIRQFLRKQSKPSDILKGKELLEKYIAKRGYDVSAVMRTSNVNKAVKILNEFHNVDEIYAQLPRNTSLMTKFAGVLFKNIDDDKTLVHIREEQKAKEIISAELQVKSVHKRNDGSNPGVIVKGTDNLMIRLAHCCNPVPGDNIIGFITKGRGISVHRVDCTNMKSLKEEDINRCIAVEWEDVKENKAYDADICMVTSDRRRMFSDISKVCEDMDIHISGVNAKSPKDGAVNIILTVSISSTHQMQKLIRTLRSIEGVENVYRARS